MGLQVEEAAGPAQSPVHLSSNLDYPRSVVVLGFDYSPSHTRGPITSKTPGVSLPSEQMQQAREDIRAAGFRATPARIATLLELRAAKSPMTHAELADRLAVQGFDKATAFRNLNDLAERGLLRRTELGDHVWRFEPIDPNHAHEKGHPHFLCVDCGSVTCLEEVQLTSSSRKQSDTVGEVTEILLRGHCHECK